MVALRKQSRFKSMFREPSVINAAQVGTNLAAASAGLLAAAGGSPTLITGQIGPVLSVVVGLTLVLGGVLGTVTVLMGNWWLERVALLVMALGWAMILPACLGVVFSGRPNTSGVWLVVALIFAALGDVFKRYKRIEWAYLDPAK
jgi:Na+/phosphate symporter